MPSADDFSSATPIVNSRAECFPQCDGPSARAGKAVDVFAPHTFELRTDIARHVGANRTVTGAVGLQPDSRSAQAAHAAVFCTAQNVEAESNGEAAIFTDLGRRMALVIRPGHDLQETYRT